MAQHRIHRFLAFLCLASVLTAGCASTWGLHAESPSPPLEWQDSSGTARAKHLMTLTGFEETGTSVPNVLKYIVFGKSAGDEIIKPVAIAAGPDGRLAIADTGCRCVHLYIPSEKKYIPLYAAKPGDIASPVGVAFDDELKLYVADSALAAIVVFDRSGRYLFSIKKAGGAALQRPTGLAYSPDKKILFAADTLAHKIYAFTTRGDVLFSFGERGAKNGQFNFPTHLSASPSGNLYVVDAMNFRVQTFDPSGKFKVGGYRHVCVKRHIFRKVSDPAADL